MAKYVLPDKDVFIENLLADKCYPSIFGYGIIVRDCKNFSFPEDHNIVMYLCDFIDESGITKTTWLPRCLIETLFNKECE